MSVADPDFIANKFNRVGAEHLVDELVRAFADGAELGPRGPHIRALGLSLQTLVEVLRTGFDTLKQLLVITGQLDLIILSVFAQLIATVEHLAGLASANTKIIKSNECP